LNSYRQIDLKVQVFDAHIIGYTQKEGSWWV